MVSFPLKMLMGFIVASLIALLEKLLQRNGGEKAYYSTTDTFLHKKREVHSAVVKMKRNT